MAGHSSRPKSGVAYRAGKRINYWDEMYLVRAYELARQGMRKYPIGAALGIQKYVWRDWCDSRPNLIKVMEMGWKIAGITQKEGKKREQETFLEYVYKRLPQKLQSLWVELEKSDGKPSEFVESLMRGHGVRVRQQMFLHALIAANFNVSAALGKMNIPYIRYNRWVTQDPEFGQLIKHVQDMKKDYVEGGLMGLIEQGDASAIIFANRTLNRDRGYDPRQTLEVNHHLHKEVDVAALDKLPLEERRKILSALREQTASQLPALPTPGMNGILLDSEGKEISEVSDE